MNHPDELLQSCLAALERGVPLEKVLAELPAEASSLAPLITMAAAARNLDHPQMSPAVAQAQRARVMGATHALRTKPARFILPQWAAGRRAPLALAGGLALFVLVVLLGISLSIAGSAAAHSVQLADVSGLVEVASAPDANDWHFIVPGERIQQGARLRTYADSGVSLVFYEGSRTAVGSDTDLTLTTLSSGPDNGLQVLLSQDAGTTTHDVIPLRGSGSYFQVDTPSGQASVHGTRFNVAVDSNGDAWFAVTHGKVQVKNDQSEVFLASGQATSVMPGQGPQDPAYQFSLEGPITAISGNIWTVQGVKITITPETDILGTYKVGDVVVVHGRILASGEWQADRVEPGRPENTKFQFTGVIESMPGVPGTWQISGYKVQVNGATELSKNLKVGSPVEVTFVILPNNGGWLATDIESLEEENRPTPTPTLTRTATSTATFTHTPGTSTATVTVTATGSATPTVTGTPPTTTPTVVTTTTLTVTPTTTMTVTPTATVIPKNGTSRCDNRSQQQPEGLRLAQRFHVTYDEIMTWFCKGFGFGEIDLAYGLSLSSGKPVSEIFSMRSSGMGWGNIKKQLSPTAVPSSGNGNGNGNGNGKGPKK